MEYCTEGKVSPAPSFVAATLIALSSCRGLLSATGAPSAVCSGQGRRAILANSSQWTGKTNVRLRTVHELGSVPYSTKNKIASSYALLAVLF